MLKQTIVFDLGGVLLDWNPRHLYRKVFKDEGEMEYFLREVCSPAWNAQMDEDVLFQDAINALIPLFPDYEDPIRIYHSRWREMIVGEITGTVEILRELVDAGYQPAALSNWSAETFPQVQDEFEFLGWFDPLVLSGKVGTAKPAPAIYELLLQELGRPAEECLFIDDRPENLEEASRQGLQTILFQSPEDLRASLVKMGIL